MNCVFTFLVTIRERKNEGPSKISGVEAVCRVEQRVLGLFSWRIMGIPTGNKEYIAWVWHFLVVLFIIKTSRRHVSLVIQRIESSQVVSWQFTTTKVNREESFGCTQTQAKFISHHFLFCFKYARLVYCHLRNHSSVLKMSLEPKSVRHKADKVIILLWEISF